MKSIFAQRSNAIEIMDDLDCNGEVVHQTLRELEFINRTLGGNQITIDGVNALLQNHEPFPSFEIIDLGCGGGDMLLLLSKKFSNKNVNLKLVGIDANPHIVEYARCNGRNSNITFECTNILSEEFESKSFDVAIATLFFHHFPFEELVNILKKLYAQVKIGIVINDLHRHPLAYYAIKLLTKLFSKSAMVKFDAPLSVLRGFSKKEIKEILSKAGVKNYALNWRWAFRWEVIIWKS